MTRLLRHYIIRELPIPISWLTPAAHRSIVTIQSLNVVDRFILEKARIAFRYLKMELESDSPQAIFGHIMRADRRPQGIKKNEPHGSLQALVKPTPWKDTLASTRTLCDRIPRLSHWMIISHQSKRSPKATLGPNSATITVLPESSSRPFHAPQVARAISIA